MKKNVLLHSEISYLIANLGHTDRIVIADCGLPVPQHVQKIDLAVMRGIPGFIDTLKAVLSEMHVEKALIADEWQQGGGQVYGEFRGVLGDIPTESISHEKFKELVSQSSVAVIRTGECTPYANVILQSGVVF